MRHRIARFFLFLLLLALTGCTGALPPSRRVNSALDFLYPQGVTAAEPASAVALNLPVRVGLAFAPNRSHQPDPITEEQKQRLLARVAAAFEEHEAIGHLEVVPAIYLQPAGGFANLDQIRGSLGLDLMVLLSYDSTSRPRPARSTGRGPRRSPSTTHEESASPPVVGAAVPWEFLSCSWPRCSGFPYWPGAVPGA